MKSQGATNQASRNDIKAVEADGAYPDYMTFEKDAATLKTAFAARSRVLAVETGRRRCHLGAGGAKGVEALEVAMKRQPRRVGPTHSSVVPYVTGGVGALTMLQKASLGINTTETFLTGNVGGGVKWYAPNVSRRTAAGAAFMRSPLAAPASRARA